jgi:hypothetical protein
MAEAQVPELSSANKIRQLAGVPIEPQAAPMPEEPPAWGEIKDSEEYKKLTYPEQVNLARQWGAETKQYASLLPDYTDEQGAQIDDFVNKDAVDVPASVKAAAATAGLIKGSAGVLGGIAGLTVGAATGPSAPVLAPALAVGGAVAASGMAEKALEKYVPNVARAGKFAPGYETAGELAPAAVTGGIGAKQLYTSGRTLFSELGAKKATEEMGKYAGKAAVSGAGVGTIARLATGGEVTPGTVASDALFGVLYSGLNANTRVKGYNFEEFKDLNYRVKNGSATQAEKADWANILNEAQNVNARGVQRAERTTVNLGRKSVVDRTRFQQGEQPVEVRPYYEPLPSAPTTPSTEIELSRQPQARPMKPATVVTPEALPESGVRGNARGTQADTAEMQRRGIPTNIQAEFTDLTPAARRQNVFSVESQGINPDAIFPSTRGLQGEIVREGPIVTPRTQLPSGERLALPAEGEPRPRTSALEAAKVIELEKGMEERIRQSPQGGYGLKTELGKVAVPEESVITGASYSDPGQQYLEWQKNINKSGSKYLAASDYDENKNWEKEGGIKIDNSYYSTIVSGDTRIAVSSSGLYLRRGKVAQSYEADIDKNGNQIYTVERIVTDPTKRGTGSASNALKNLTDIADKSNVTLQLEPAVVESLSKKGQKALTFQQLGDWYKRNGFVPKFDGSNSVLIREPKQNISKPTIPRPMGGSAGEGGFVSTDVSKLVKNYMTSAGALTNDMADTLLASKYNKAQLKYEAQFRIRDFNRALIKETGSSNLTPELSNAIKKYMYGETEDASLIPPQTLAATKRLRSFLDQGASRIVNEPGLLSEGQRETVLGNIGSYMSRDYAKFYDKNFTMDKLEAKDKKKFAQSVDFVRRQFLDRAKQEVDDAAEAGRPPIEWLRKINETQSVPMERLMGEVQRIVEQGGIRELGQKARFNPESYGLSKDLTGLKRRKDIPEEVRYLMGEYDDPRIGFLRGAMKQINLFVDNRTLTKLREQGFASGLFFDYPAPNTVEIAPKGSEVMSPLNGVYADPMVAKALNNFDVAFTSNIPGLSTFSKVNTIIKWSKTVGSLRSQARNFIFNIPIQIQNGNFDFLTGKDFGRTTSMIMADYGFSGDTQQIRNQLRRAVGLGVMNNAKFNEMEALMKDASIDRGDIQNFVERNFFGKLSGPAAKVIDSAANIKNFLDFMYRTGDNFHKIALWRYRVNSLMEGKKMSEADAEIEAADWVNDRFATYEKLPPALKALRANPFAKNFISWNAERIRNSYHSIKGAIEDMRTPGMEKYGMRTIIGNILGLTISLGSQMMAAYALGWSYEKIKQLNNLAPGYQKSATLLPVGYDPKNQEVTYIDISYSDPFDIIRQPINAFMSGDALDKKLIGAIGTFFGDFLGFSIATETLAGVMKNERADGTQIVNPKASPAAKLGAWSEYLGRTIEPGTISDMRQLYFAIKGQPDPFFGPRAPVPSIPGMVSSFAGFRVQKLNLGDELFKKSRSFNNAMGQSTRLFTGGLVSRGTPNRDVLASGAEQMDRARIETFKDMSKVYNSALSWGLSEDQAVSEMRRGGISKENIAAIISGEVPQFRVGRSMLKELYRDMPEDSERRMQITRELLNQEQ